MVIQIQKYLLLLPQLIKINKMEEENVFSNNQMLQELQRYFAGYQEQDERTAGSIKEALRKLHDCYSQSALSYIEEILCSKTETLTTLTAVLKSMVNYLVAIKDKEQRIQEEHLNKLQQCDQDNYQLSVQIQNYQEEIYFLQQKLIEADKQNTHSEILQEEKEEQIKVIQQEMEKLQMSIKQLEQNNEEPKEKQEIEAIKILQEQIKELREKKEESKTLIQSQITIKKLMNSNCKLKNQLKQIHEKINSIVVQNKQLQREGKSKQDLERTMKVSKNSTVLAKNSLQRSKSISPNISQSAFQRLSKNISNSICKNIFPNVNQSLSQNASLNYSLKVCQNPSQSLRPSAPQNVPLQVSQSISQYNNQRYVFLSNRINNKNSNSINSINYKSMNCQSIKSLPSQNTLSEKQENKLQVFRKFFQRLSIQPNQVKLVEVAPFTQTIKSPVYFEDQSECSSLDKKLSNKFSKKHFNKYQTTQVANLHNVRSQSQLTIGKHNTSYCFDKIHLKSNTINAGCNTNITALPKNRKKKSEKLKIAEQLLSFVVAPINGFKKKITSTYQLFKNRIEWNQL